VDNIQIDLRETGWDGIDWIDLAQDKDPWRALVKTVMNLRGPYNSGKFLNSCTIDSFSRRAQWRWGRFSPNTSVSSANLHSTNFSTITITYHPGLVQ
jgi:hypothetical protein